MPAPKNGNWTQERLEEFVRRWQRGDALTEIAEWAGVATNTINTLALRLRKSGVPLAKRYRGFQIIDYGKLAEIAKTGATK